MAVLRAVLLDLDGTLVDSAEDIKDALNTMLADEGLPPLGIDAVRAMIGDGALKLVERGLAAAGGDPARAPALLLRFLAAYAPRAARTTRPYPGVLATLQALRQAGLRFAVVTNKPEAASRAILAALGLAPLIDVVIGGDTTPTRKPDPGPVLEALRRLAVAPAAAVMVGDNHHDVAAAHGAGVPVILVAYGYPHGDARALGADLVIDRFSDLPAALRLPISPAPAS